MRKQLLLLAVFALSLFGLQTALAQNYQPFSRNLTYHFSAQDSIYALKIDTAFVQAGDSVFVFNKIAKKVYNYSKPVCPPGSGGPNQAVQYAVYGQNQFGQKMIEKPNGVYVFETLQGPQFELRTKASVGQSWPVMSGVPVTVTLTSKGVEPVLTTTDSVLTFTVMTGEVIKLSKNYGFLKVPNLVSYVDSYFSFKDLTFYALPEKGLGAGVNNPFNIFDFQPGDIFMHYLKEELYNAPLCWEVWTREEIISKSVSPDGLTLQYQIRRQVLERGHGFPGAPSSFCNRPQGFTLHPASIYTKSFARYNALANNFLSQHYKVQQPGSVTSPGTVVSGIYKDPAYNNWERIDTREYGFDNCAKTFDLRVDQGASLSYVAGIGMVYHSFQIFDGYRTEVLQGYQKNGVIYGNLRTMAQIMSTPKDKELAPALNISPNPAENTIALKFDQPLTTGKLTVTILNTLGQITLQKEFTEVPEKQVNLNLEKLAKGIYIVQANQNGKTITSRFVKQ